MNDTSSPGGDEFQFERQLLMEFFRNFPFNKLMGMELLEVEPGRSRMAMSWREDLCQPAGILHGGTIASLADTAIAHAILLTAPYREIHSSGGRIVSLDLRVKYLRPVSEGKIFCEARVIRQGRQIVHADAVVTNEQGKDVALGDSIYMLVRREQLTKRE